MEGSPRSRFISCTLSSKGHEIIPKKKEKPKHVFAAVSPAPAWMCQFNANAAHYTFMFHYRPSMTTSICHLILFIIPAAALSDLSPPMAGFNTAMRYIMIMSGLDAGLLSASH